METFSNVMYHTDLITVLGVAGNFVIFAKNFAQISRLFLYKESWSWCLVENIRLKYHKDFAAGFSRLWSSFLIYYNLSVHFWQIMVWWKYRVTRWLHKAWSEGVKGRWRWFEEILMEHLWGVSCSANDLLLRAASKRKLRSLDPL